jgi:hypothetical protein
MGLAGSNTMPSCAAQLSWFTLCQGSGWRWGHAGAALGGHEGANAWRAGRRVETTGASSPLTESLQLAAAGRACIGPRTMYAGQRNTGPCPLAACLPAGHEELLKARQEEMTIMLANPPRTLSIWRPKKVTGVA